MPEFDSYGCRVGPAYRSIEPVERLLEQREIRVAARRAIEALPESYRNVLLLRDIEERDTEETAALLVGHISRYDSLLAPCQTGASAPENGNLFLAGPLGGRSDD